MQNFIAITGNIGAGKTSLAKKMAEYLDWQHFQEPHTENPYLELFYKDKSRWSFQCEMYFLGKRLEHHLQILDHSISTIQDRCIYEGAEIFVKYLYLSKHLSEHDWNTYQTLYSAIKKNITAPTLLIYIKSSTKRCLNNIKHRNRNYENDMPETYIEDLNKLYEEWSQTFDLCPVITLNSDNYEHILNDTCFKNLLTDINKHIQLQKLF